MSHAPGSRAALTRSLVLALALLVPAAPAQAWGSLGHRTIAGAWAGSLPWPLDGLAADEAWVIDHVMDPDTRKSTVPGEGERHYIDIDAYPEYHAGTLSHDRAVLEAAYGAAQVRAWGLAPWAVGEVTDSLTAAMATGRWDRARLWIADLCHYVGDLHQPLHCTLNYDGQLTGNTGIHSRYESRMLDLNAAALVLEPGAATYLPDPVDAAFAIAGASQARASEVIAADTEARAAAGGSTSSGTYYAGLWTRTQGLTLARLDAAAVSTASFLYTAWADAGFPPVPNATADAPAGAWNGLALAAGPVPARDRLELRSAAGAGGAGVHARRRARAPRGAARGRAAGRPDPGTALGAGHGRVGAPPPGVYFSRMAAGAQEAAARVVVTP